MSSCRRPTNDSVEISDTAEHLHALTAAELRGLPNIGVTSLHDCQGATTFSAAQTSALAASKIELSAAGTCAIGATFTDGAAIAFGASASGGGALTLTAGARREGQRQFVCAARSCGGRDLGADAQRARTDQRDGSDRRDLRLCDGLRERRHRRLCDRVDDPRHAACSAPRRSARV